MAYSLARKATLWLALALAITTTISHSSPSSGNTILLGFEPSDTSEWYVNITASIDSKVFKCRGVVGVNTFYRETRSISKDLLVAPLYYVLDSVCPRLTAYLNSLPRERNDSIELVFSYPQGYTFFSALDGRGFGSKGVYIVPLSMLLRYYLYDGIVLASLDKYVALEYKGFTVVSPREAMVESVGKVAETVYCVASFLQKALGPSPRSPVAVVVSPLSEHEHVLPGTGYSLGGVLYVKQPAANIDDAIVHIAAHETVHSWIGKGPLRGDEALVEGASELLALLGLRNCSRELYNLAYRHVASSARISKYYSWLLIHKALREASLKACSEDLYLKALNKLYQERSKGNIESLMKTIASLASLRDCRERLAREIGYQLLGIDKKILGENNSHNTSRTGRSPTREDRGVLNASKTTITITVTTTTTKVEIVHSYKVNHTTTARPSPGCYYQYSVYAALLVLAAVALALLAITTRAK